MTSPRRRIEEDEDENSHCTCVCHNPQHHHNNHHEDYLVKHCTCVGDVRGQIHQEVLLKTLLGLRLNSITNKQQ